jgi:hypothetical protein
VAARFFGNSVRPSIRYSSNIVALCKCRAGISAWKGSVLPFKNVYFTTFHIFTSLANYSQSALSVPICEHFDAGGNKRKTP